MLLSGITRALKKWATKMANVYCVNLFLGHLSNFVILSFVPVSRKYFGEEVLRPLACCALGQLPPPLCPPPLVTPLEYDEHLWAI